MNEIPGLFSGRSAAYTASRPSYAEGALDAILTIPGLPDHPAAADIGSGTGIFTSQLLERGCTVYAVEPDPGMRRRAEERLSGCPGFTSVAADASHTTLPNACADLVTAAQAFHWFDADAFRTECRRILKPGGAVALLWNFTVAESPLNAGWRAVSREFCPLFTALGKTIGSDEERNARFFDGRFTFLRFDHPLFYDREAYVQRALSSSYALRPGDPRYAEYVGALNDLFSKYEENGRVRVENATHLYIGTV